MKKTISAILMLTLCLSLCACSFVVIPDRQNDQITEPKVTIDPNAEPEIVTDAASVKQEPLDTGSEQPVCYFRSTEGTNCGIPGIVFVEYLDANENVLHTFSPQLPGGTLSAGGFAGGKTYVTERIDQRSISYEIDTETGKLLSCEHFEVNDRDYRCTRIDLYDNDGQVAVSVESSIEGRILRVQHFVDQQRNDWAIIYEGFEVYETATVYTDRTLYYKNLNMVAEISGDPMIGLDDGMMFAENRKVEIKNGCGELLGIYEASGENSLVGAGVGIESGMVYVEEQRFDHHYILREQINPTTGAIVSRETFDYSEDGTLIQEETTRWAKNGIVSFHWLITYDASGEVNSNEIEFWGGKVVTTFDTTYNGFYSKAEFYNAEGVLQKTVEPVDGSIGFLLVFSEDDRCEIRFYDKDGNIVGYDSYRPKM